MNAKCCIVLCILSHIYNPHMSIKVLLAYFLCYIIFIPHLHNNSKAIHLHIAYQQCLTTLHWQIIYYGMHYKAPTFPHAYQLQLSLLPSPHTVCTSCVRACTLNLSVRDLISLHCVLQAPALYNICTPHNSN